MILRAQNADWILVWVACLIAFIYVFFPSWKAIFFKQSRHLLDTWLSVELLNCFLSQSRHFLKTRWINRENSWILDSFSTACGLIELLFLYLSFVPWHLLDSCIYRRYFSRHLYLSRIIEDLYIGFSAIWSSFSRSLSIYLCLFTSQTLSSLSKPLTYVIFGLSLLQITWYDFFFSHFSCISCI